MEYQGGRMTPAEVAAFESNPLSADMVALRLCDDEAKVPGWQVGSRARLCVCARARACAG